AVIGASVGGIVDAVTDCENGKLVSTNDPNELANAINELLSDELLRMKFGSAAHQTIMDKFTLQAELDGNLSVYRYLGLKM
ncbi:MAG TPA: glycosyltransferase, partial [Anaerolineales bacterium]